MARGNPVFAKVDCSIRHGERFVSLRPGTRAIYLCLWLLAVETRSEFLSAERYSIAHLAHEVEVSRWVLAEALLELDHFGLVRLETSPPKRTESVREVVERELARRTSAEDPGVKPAASAQLARSESAASAQRERSECAADNLHTPSEIFCYQVQFPLSQFCGITVIGVKACHPKLRWL